MSDWTQGAGGPLYRSPEIMPGSVLGDALAAASAKSRKLSGWKTGMLAPVDRNIVTGELRPAVPMFIQDAIRGVMAPGKAMRGEYGLTASPDGRVSYDGMAEDAAALAGTIGVSGGAVPKLPNTLGMFGGVMAKTADKAALDTAQKMAEKGATKQEIWDATGWFKGADDKWRFEIDDSNSKFWGPTQRRFGSAAVGDVVDTNNATIFSHPQLHQAYDLQGIDMQLSKSGGPTTAQFQKQESGKESIFLQAPTLDTARQASLHELQHSIQQREGFAQGGGPSQFQQQADAELARSAMSWRQELGVKRQQMPNASDAEIERAALAEYADAGLEPPPTEARSIARDTANNPDVQLQEIIKLYQLDKQMSVPTPMDMYRRLAGEVEARNVEKRRDLTPEQRRAKAPWLTQDVPDERQIVRF